MLEASDAKKGLKAKAGKAAMVLTSVKYLATMLSVVSVSVASFLPLSVLTKVYKRKRPYGTLFNYF